MFTINLQQYMIYKPSYLSALTHSTLLCICQRNQKKRLLCKVKEMRMDVSGLQLSIPT